MDKRNIRFRQAIFKKGKFEKFHHWGFSKDSFKGPVSITGPETKVKKNQMFTGRIDYYNISIYEGDLIINQSRNNKKSHEVIFFRGKFMAKYSKLIYDFIEEISREKIKVVGNIYEKKKNES